MRLPTFDEMKSEMERNTMVRFEYAVKDKET